MKNNTSILMGGVGGQGIVLASRLLAHVIQAHNHELKISEIHGMAQRRAASLPMYASAEKFFAADRADRQTIYWLRKNWKPGAGCLTCAGEVQWFAVPRKSNRCR